MKLAIFSRTPLAGAPWELYKALKRYTDIKIRTKARRIKEHDHWHIYLE